MTPSIKAIIAIAAVLILGLSVTNVVTASNESKLKQQYTIAQSQITQQQDSIDHQATTIAGCKVRIQADSATIADMHMDYKVIGVISAQYAEKIATIVSKHQVQ